MKVFVGIALLCVLMTSWIAQNAQAFKVCGDDTPKPEVDAAIKGIVSKLMTARNSRWSWEFWSTTIVLQVSAPKMFFGREKTSQEFQKWISANWDELGFFDKCEAAFAARALCLPPTKVGGKNLLNEINDALGYYATKPAKLEPEELIEYNFGISALCINGFQVDKNLVSKLLELQNTDGSFGTGPYGYLASVWVLRPIICLSRMSNPDFSLTKVQAAVTKLREYVIKSLTNETGKLTFGGFDFLTHDALISLYKAMPENENTSRWLCHELMKDLGVHAQNHEDEETLTSRLMGIVASDYLDMQSKDYKCLPKEELDEIPKGYVPKCNYEKPESCGIPPPADDYDDEEEEHDEDEEE